jgi:hypothetical protein
VLGKGWSGILSFEVPSEFLLLCLTAMAWKGLGFFPLLVTGVVLDEPELASV